MRNELIKEVLDRVMTHGIAYFSTEQEQIIVEALNAMLVAPEVEEIARLRDDNQRYLNGFLNLSKAFEEAPGLPLELLSEDDLAKWTDIITSVLMVCGILEHDGRPLTMLESLAKAASHLPQSRSE